MTILDKIIAHKINEVSDLKKKTSLRELEKSRLFTKKTCSLSDQISNPAKTGIIAEFKRRSPSKGLINSDADPGVVTRGYSLSGASGLSVLTDNHFFAGSCADLTLISDLNTVPVLRKDFIIDEFQVVESKAAGADAILLIASILEKKKILRFAKLAQSLLMEVLLEVHTLQDIQMTNENVNLIGVNNRDLKSFSVNTNVSLELADKIPDGYLKISESGISSPVTIKMLRNAGFDGFLIGGLFMSEKDPVSAFSDFVKRI